MPVTSGAITGWAWAVLCASQLGCVGPADLEESEAGPSVDLFGAEAISTEANEFAVAFSPSGDTACFNRTSDDRSQLELMVSVRIPEGWSEAEVLEPSAGLVAIDPFVTAEPHRLYTGGGYDPATDTAELKVCPVRVVPSAAPA